MLCKDFQGFFVGALAHGLASVFLPALILTPFEKLGIPVLAKVFAGVLGAQEIAIRADSIDHIQRQGFIIYFQPPS